MNRLHWMTLTAAVTSLAALSTAQEDKPKDTKSPPAQTRPDATSMSNKAPCVMLARDLIGRSVTNPQTENIGKIEDIVVRPNGEIGYAVLSFGGVMGVGDKLFAIPWSVLKAAEENAVSKDPKDPMAYDKKSHDAKLVLPIDKERLKNAPGFDKKNWPTMASADWMREIDAYYTAEKGKVAEKDKDTSKAMEAGSKSAFAFKASELKGTNVETPGGDKLGDINDVAIDVHGHVSYVVLSVGGFLGMGERHVAVPWQALQVTRDGDKKKFTLPTTKDRLEKAPQFAKDKEKWSQMCDPNWIGTVYDYYSVEPYWSDDERP